MVIARPPPTDNTGRPIAGKRGERHGQRSALDQGQEPATSGVQQGDRTPSHDHGLVYVDTRKQVDEDDIKAIATEDLPSFRLSPDISVLLYLFDQTALADADLLSGFQIFN